MNTKIAGLICLIISISLCFVNEIIAAPMFVIFAFLFLYEMIFTSETPSFCNKEYIIPTEIPSPVIVQQKTEASEHVFEYPNGTTLTVRKVTKWH